MWAQKRRKYLNLFKKINANRRHDNSVALVSNVFGLETHVHCATANREKMPENDKEQWEKWR